MGIFDFLKKTEATKPTETTESNKDAEEAKGNACVVVSRLEVSCSFAIPTKEWKVLVL